METWTSLMDNNLKWEDSLIVKPQKFFQKRFKYSELRARSLGTTLITPALGDLNKFRIYNELGEVHANPWFMNIGKSGLAFKTPAVKMVRRILRNYNKEVICPTSFNPETFVEYIQGTDGKGDGKQKRKEIPPHPVNVCVIDEASKLLGATKRHHYQANQREFLAQLWDGEIEGKYTRQYQIEGNVEVFFSLSASTSEYFYKLLDEAWWTVGTGNRILYNPTTTFNPIKVDKKTFWKSGGLMRDPDFEKLTDEIVCVLKIIQAQDGITIREESGELWCDFFNATTDKIEKLKTNEAEYMMKLPYNAIKLAMCYSASRLSIENRVIQIDKQDMKHAIQDVMQYHKNWKVAQREWKKKSEDRNKDILKSKKDDVEKFCVSAMENGGTICAGEVSNLHSIKNRVGILEVLSLAKNQEYLELAYDHGENKNISLSEDELIHYKKVTSGNMAYIYRATEKCYEEFGGV